MLEGTVIKTVVAIHVEPAEGGRQKPATNHFLARSLSDLSSLEVSDFFFRLEA